jgi:hypothetical protein
VPSAATAIDFRRPANGSAESEARLPEWRARQRLRLVRAQRMLRQTGEILAPRGGSARDDSSPLGNLLLTVADLASKMNSIQ